MVLEIIEGSENDETKENKKKEGKRETMVVVVRLFGAIAIMCKR